MTDPVTELLNKIITRETHKGSAARVRNLAEVEIKKFIAEERREAEIALARKVLGVSNYSIYRRGITMKKRLDLLTEHMSKIIPDIFETGKENL